MKTFKKVIKYLFLLMILGTIVFLYSKYLNAVGFKVQEKTLYSSKFPKEFDGLKIVQISDIHYGTSVKKEEMNNIVKRINLIKPDIVFLTGDLLNNKVDYSDQDIKDLTKQLKKINTTIDKYAILGDKDYPNTWESIINDSEFINLNDTYQVIYKNNDKFLIGGISTTSKGKLSQKIGPITKYLSENDMYSILIMHEPDTIKNIDYDKFNLVLAGHSLGGQFKIPGIGGLIHKKGAKKYINSYYKLNNTKLYISNGLGNYDINYRFLNKPSFNLFRLRSKS